MTRNNIPNGRAWLTPSEAATYTGVSATTLRSEIRAGRLAAFKRVSRRDGKPTGGLAISRADLDAYMRRYPVVNPRDVMHAVGVFAIMAVGMAWPIIEGLAW